jgi:glucuronate isomerase
MLIANNHQFADVSELWLGGDHYKWRAMRTNGVAERFVTGNASPREKFQAWAETVPHTLRNPLYHWTHLELKRYFGVDQLLDGKSAEKVWKQANAKLAKLRAHDLINMSKVAVICTTDDPADSLDVHARIRANPGKLKARVYPAFRPDKALAVGNPAAFNAWIEKLAGAAGFAHGIKTFDDLLSALKKRHDDFHAAGGRLSDHGLEHALSEPCTHAQAKVVFDAVRGGRRGDTGGDRALRLLPDARVRSVGRRARLDQATPPRCSAEQQHPPSHEARARYRVRFDR